MPFFFPDQLSGWSGGKWQGKKPDKISGFSIDARQIKEGEMFVALKAARDGHEFLEQAGQNGASSALVKSPRLDLEIPQLVVEDTLSAFQDMAAAHRHGFEKPLVGISGSCGKTSTKEMLSLLLGEATHKTEGNLNNYLGVPLTLLRLEPEVHDAAVVEVGINQVGEMEKLATMSSPTHVLITMIGESHLEGLRNLETIALEKGKLFEASQAKAIFHEECLKYHNFRQWRDRGKPCLTLFEGEPEQGVVPEGTAYYQIWTETNKIGDSCTLRLWRRESPVLFLPLPNASEGMRKNLALSVLAASELGVSDEIISERLPQYRPSTLRANCFQGRGRTYFVDCYNANPSSMIDSLTFFAERHGATPKLYILGGMEELGSEERKLHAKVSSSIRVESNDLFVMIGEKASWFADGLLKGGADEEQLVVLDDLDSARSLVEDFQGAVMLKGSRASRLEQLLPSWAVREVEAGELAKC